MKWIGQSIQSFISRFRNDVYLESLSTTTEANVLVVDSTGKISKNTSVGGDLTSIVAGTGLSGTSLAGPIPTLNVDASQTQITSVGTIGTGVWQGTTIKTAYIGDDQVTEDKLANTLLAEIDANTAKATNVTTNLSGTTSEDAYRVNSSDGTNVVIAEASGSIAGVMSVLHHDKLDAIEASATADQTRSDIDGLGITVLGNITSGSWSGSVIASAKLDADTAHLSGAQTFTGTKTLNSFKGTAGATVTNILDEDAMGSNSATALATQQSIKAYADTKVSKDTTKQLTHHMVQDDVDTSVVYISLGEIDAESGTVSNKNLPLLAPFAGKLLKVFLRSTANISGVDVTWKLYTRTSSQSTNGNAAEIGAITGTGPTNVSMATYDFTGTLDGDTGTNAVGAGDKVLLSIETSGSTANSNLFITLLWEWDLS